MRNCCGNKAVWVDNVPGKEYYYCRECKQEVVDKPGYVTSDMVNADEAGNMAVITGNVSYVLNTGPNTAVCSHKFDGITYSTTTGWNKVCVYCNAVDLSFQVKGGLGSASPLQTFDLDAAGVTPPLKLRSNGFFGGATLDELQKRRRG